MSKFLLEQFEAIYHRFIACYLGEEAYIYYLHPFR